MTLSDSEFRRFALGVYGAANVSAAALLLQDRADVDVNVLLLAAFIGASRGRILRAEDIAAIHRRIGPWQRDVVRPLRDLRIRLRTGPPPAPNNAAGQLREQVKALELDAELIEMDELLCVAAQFDAPSASGSPAARGAAAMQVVVTEIAGRRPSADEDRAISLIAAAAAQYVEEE